MKTLNVIQGSDAWLAARAGKHRASRTADMLAKTKSGWGASRENYKSEIVCELLTNRIEPSFTSPAMQRGIDLEAKARSAFELVQSVDVQTVGLVIHPTIENFVASPDGLIGEDGLVEIKCPNTSTIIDYHLKSEVPNKYILQIQSQLACTERSYCYFVAYDDRLPPDLSLFVKKIERDDALIKTIEKETITFLDECFDTLSQLKSLQQREAA